MNSAGWESGHGAHPQSGIISIAPPALSGRQHCNALAGNAVNPGESPLLSEKIP
jgi:hypothetical protein